MCVLSLYGVHGLCVGAFYCFPCVLFSTGGKLLRGEGVDACGSMRERVMFYGEQEGRM